MVRVPISIPPYGPDGNYSSSILMNVAALAPARSIKASIKYVVRPGHKHRNGPSYNQPVNCPRVNCRWPLGIAAPRYTTLRVCVNRRKSCGNACLSEELQGTRETRKGCVRVERIFLSLSLSLSLSLYVHIYVSSKANSFVAVWKFVKARVWEKKKGGERKEGGADCRGNERGGGDL